MPRPSSPDAKPASLPPVGHTGDRDLRSVDVETRRCQSLGGRRALARTSKTPGRTRGITFTTSNRRGQRARALRLVIAGVRLRSRLAGRARVGQAGAGRVLPRAAPTLALFVVLVDARRGLEAEERQLLEWLATLSIPVRFGYQGRQAVGVPPGPPARIGASASRRDGHATVGVWETGEGIDVLWEAILRSLPASMIHPRSTRFRARFATRIDPRKL